MKETNLISFPIDVSDQDTMDDDNEGDLDSTVDNMIGIALNPGETDTGNDFVDNSEATLTSAGQTTVELSPAPTDGAPVVIETEEPTASDACKEVLIDFNTLPHNTALQGGEC